MEGAVVGTEPWQGSMDTSAVKGFATDADARTLDLTTPFTLFSAIMIFAVVGDNIARFWDNSLAGMADIEYLVYLVDPDCFAIWLNRKL